jgi:hypothetical protein
LVVVEITEQAVDRVRRLARRDLPLESAFWTYLARRAVAARLWAEGRVAEHRVQVADVGLEDVDAARRWVEDPS